MSLIAVAITASHHVHACSESGRIRRFATQRPLTEERINPAPCPDRHCDQSKLPFGLVASEDYRPAPPPPPVIPTEVDVEAHVAKLYPPEAPLPSLAELSPESDYPDAIISPPSGLADCAVRALLGRIDPIDPRVNARDLHAFLGIGRDFSNWIKDLIEKHEFVEGEDFTTFAGLSSPNSASPKARAQITKEYSLTLDMAKEVSMLAANEKGKRARRYFIDCEKQFRQSRIVTPDLNDRLTVLKVLEDTTRKAIEAEEGRRDAIAHVTELEEVVEKTTAASEAELDRLRSKVEAPKRAISFKQFFKETESTLGYTTRTGYPYLLAAGILVKGQRNKWGEVYVPSAEFNGKSFFQIVNSTYERPDDEADTPDPTAKRPLTVHTCSTRLTPDVKDANDKVTRQGGFTWLYNRMLKDPRTALSRMQATNGGRRGKYGKLYGCQLVEVKGLEFIDDRTCGPEVIHFYKIPAKKKADVRWEVSRHIGDGRLIRQRACTLEDALDGLCEATPDTTPRTFSLGAN